MCGGVALDLSILFSGVGSCGCCSATLLAVLSGEEVCLLLTEAGNGGVGGCCCGSENLDGREGFLDVLVTVVLLGVSF